MTQPIITASTDFSPTRAYVAAEIWHLRNGFNVLRGMLYDLREVEGAVTTEMINRLEWAADHVKTELDEACEHAEALSNDERAEVAARRRVVLQAAE